jgi:hypothetical protein
MSYILCTDKAKIAKAQRVMLGAVKKGSQLVQGPLGTRAGSDFDTYHWRPDLKLWVVTNELDNRYWNAFGIDEPSESVGSSIICEVNFPYSGTNRRIAAVLIEDERGRLWVGHSGKIGGGRKGIGKLSFWDHYRGGEPVTVTYPDGKDSEFIVLGRIGDKRLPFQLAGFIREVARIKSVITGSTPSSPEPSNAARYNPEFVGRRRSYPLGGIVESETYHGLVVDALSSQLEKANLAHGNRGGRDMYVLGRGERMTFLFEVKTDLTPASIYKAIGQLMFHGAQADKAPRRVIVLPGRPNKRTELALERLSIKTVSYELLGRSRVRFSGLAEVLGKPQ